LAELNPKADLLESLFAGAIKDSQQREQLVPRSELLARIELAPEPLNAYSLLKAGDRVKVISEIKRASPSRGKMAEISDPASLAVDYEQAGAAAISVLTEQRSFLGSLGDLVSVRSAVEIPILRKDFIANEYQVLEARANGADIVLLIVAGLEKVQLKSLLTLIERLGMSALVETHSQSEVEIASDLGAKLVGINARDLSTFDTDRELFSQLANNLPSECVKIAESAVRDLGDVESYAAGGADAVLVGEALVTGDHSSLIREFSSVPRA
jgi:indole-3-glycerol phosphate synthase